MKCGFTPKPRTTNLFYIFGILHQNAVLSTIVNGCLGSTHYLMLFIDKGYYAWKRIFEQIFSVNKDPSRQLTESTVHVWCDTLHTYWTKVLNCSIVTDVGVPHSGALVWRILGTREGAQHYRGTLQYGIQSEAKSTKTLRVFYIDGKNSSNCIFFLDYQK